MDNPKPTQNSLNYSMPGQLQDALSSMASLTKHLLEISKTLIYLRRELRGEVLLQDDEGKNHWIQITKPRFIKLNLKTGKPLKRKVIFPGETIETEVFIPNDEAIDEILSALKFMGVNQVSPLGNIGFDNYMDDLREFECKLAAILALKQKEWGLDKEMLPMIQLEIKTLVQDIRSMSVNGNMLKALQTNVQRVEQLIEGDGARRREKVNPY